MRYEKRCLESRDDGRRCGQCERVAGARSQHRPCQSCNFVIFAANHLHALRTHTNHPVTIKQPLCHDKTLYMILRHPLADVAFWMVSTIGQIIDSFSTSSTVSTKMSTIFSNSSFVTLYAGAKMQWSPLVPSRLAPPVIPITIKPFSKHRA